MNLSISNSDIHAAEQRWLGRYGWIFIALGIPLGIAVDGLFWVAITLDRSYLPKSFADWITLKGILFGCAVAILPFLWRIGLWMEKKWGTILKKYSFVPAMVVLVVALADIAARSFPVQDLLWQSVRARAGSDYFAREISLLRLDSASQSAMQDEKPGIVVAGSSQMLHAMDTQQLTELTQLPVHRRATAGMFPLELCAARGFMDFNSGNVLLLMLSGFDLGGRDDLYTDAIRPMATFGGIKDLIVASDRPFLVKKWRQFVDLKTASMVESWRSRDYIRFVFSHPFELKRDQGAKSVDPELVNQQRQAYQHLGKNKEVVALSQSALQLFLRHLSSRVKRIVVVEGQVNPEYPDPGEKALSATMREFLLEQERSGEINFISIEEQGMTLNAGDWLDMAHVNQSGRTKYTAMFARVLTETIKEDL